MYILLVFVYIYDIAVAEREGKGNIEYLIDTKTSTLGLAREHKTKLRRKVTVGEEEIATQKCRNIVN